MISAQAPLLRAMSMGVLPSLSRVVRASGFKQIEFIDIIGNIPIIIDLRKKVGHIQSEKASLIAGAIMIFLTSMPLKN